MKTKILTLTAFILFVLTTVSICLAYTYEQKLEYPTGFFWDPATDPKTFPYHRNYYEDWGWNHICPTDIWIGSATLEIRSYDVDESSGEVDEIFADGDSLGYLTGSSYTWSTNTFNIPTNILTDGLLEVWMDIDVTSYSPSWLVTLEYSKLTVEYYYLLPEVDIKLHSHSNVFNVKQKGKLSVAVLTTDTFDALTLNPETVEANGVAPLRWSIKDVDGDGDLDLLMRYDSQEIAATMPTVEDGDEVVCKITGLTFDGYEYLGTDMLRIIKKGK